MGTQFLVFCHFGCLRCWHYHYWRICCCGCLSLFDREYYHYFCCCRHYFFGVILVSFFWVDDKGFGSAPAFCSNDMSFWASQDLVLWLFESQCLPAFRLELSKRLALSPFRDTTQSLHRCHSPNEPDFFIFSGGEAFWHIWIVHLSLGQQVRMRYLLVFGIRPKIQINSGSLDRKLFAENCVSPHPLTGVLGIAYGTQSEFLPNSLCWGCWFVWTSAESHHAPEGGNSEFCLLPWVTYQFSDLFGTDLHNFQFFLISHQRQALLSLGIGALSIFW